MVQFDLEKVLNDFLLQKKVECRNKDLFLLCIKGIVEPCDGRKWPASWRKSESRLVGILSQLEDEYWKVFERFGAVPQAELVEWNNYSGMDRAKVLRMFGKSVAVVKVYPGGRYFWDFLVLCMLKGSKDLKEVAKASVAKANVQFIVPKWVWKFCKMCPDAGGGTKVDHGVEVITDG